MESIVLNLPSDILQRLRHRAEREKTELTQICQAVLAQVALADQFVTGMKFGSGRPTPQGTEAIIEFIGHDDKVRVKLKLPWQNEHTDWMYAPIVNHEVILPGLKLAFLCHAKEDKDSVASVGARLIADGFMTWYDEKDLLPGDEWEATIETAIEECDVFLAFLSSRSCLKRGYVQRELRYALKQRDRLPLGRRFIIPILLDDCNPPREFRDIHFLRYWEEGAYDRLKTALMA